MFDTVVFSVIDIFDACKTNNQFFQGSKNFLLFDSFLNISLSKSLAFTFLFCNSLDMTTFIMELQHEITVQCLLTVC